MRWLRDFIDRLRFRRHPATHRAGLRAERRALRHLRWRGMRLVERRARVGRDEIDLVLRHRDHLIFVEVRFRGRGLGQADRSFDREKRRRFRRAILAYRRRHRLQGIPWRGDLVLVTGKGGTGPSLVHRPGVLGDGDPA